MTTEDTWLVNKPVYGGYNVQATFTLASWPENILKYTSVEYAQFTNEEDAVVQARKWAGEYQDQTFYLFEADQTIKVDPSYAVPVVHTFL